MLRGSSSCSTSGAPTHTKPKATVEATNSATREEVIRETFNHGLVLELVKQKCKRTGPRATRA